MYWIIVENDKLVLLIHCSLSLVIKRQCWNKIFLATEIYSPQKRQISKVSKIAWKNSEVELQSKTVSYFKTFCMHLSKTSPCVCYPEMLSSLAYIF